jgi:hypothetical protein
MTGSNEIIWKEKYMSKKAKVWDEMWHFGRLIFLSISVFASSCNVASDDFLRDTFFLTIINMVVELI